REDFTGFENRNILAFIPGNIFLYLLLTHLQLEFIQLYSVGVQVVVQIHHGKVRINRSVEGNLRCRKNIYLSSSSVWLQVSNHFDVVNFTSLIDHLAFIPNGKGKMELAFYQTTHDFIVSSNLSFHPRRVR